MKPAVIACEAVNEGGHSPLLRLLPSPAGRGHVLQRVHEPPANPRAALHISRAVTSRSARTPMLAVKAPAPCRLSPVRRLVLSVPLEEAGAGDGGHFRPFTASCAFVLYGTGLHSALYPNSRLSDRRGCSAACPSPARSFGPKPGLPCWRTRPRRPAVRRVRLE
jgi:hypothetical protein